MSGTETLYTLDAGWMRALTEGLSGGGIETGRGFWIFSDSELSTEGFVKSDTAVTGEIVIELEPGWNMIGNPYDFAVDAGKSMSVAGASFQTSAAVKPDIYGYDSAAGGYVKVRTLEPWNGYFVYAKRETNLTFSSKQIEGKYDYYALGIGGTARIEQGSVAEPPYISGQLIAAFQAGVTEAQATAGLNAAGLKVVGWNKSERMYQASLPAGMTIEQGIAAASSVSGVSVASKNYVMSPGALPNDMVFTNPPATDAAWGYLKIGLGHVWKEYTAYRNPTIAVLDTGIDAGHSELAGRVLAGRNFADAGAVSDTSDGNGHGTQIAGIIAAGGDNGAGIAGVCWNCRALPVKVCDAGGHCPLFSVLTGISYAAAAGAQVINVSLGADFPEGSPVDALFQEAISGAKIKGAVVVGAAGNGAHDARRYFPGANADAFSVAASDINDKRTPFSNYGAMVSFAAPGDDIYTLTKGNSYINARGTSMSAAFVSGAAGLLLSANAGLSSRDAMQVIAATVDPLPGEDIAGRLNISRALEFLLNTPSQNRAPSIKRISIDPVDITNAPNARLAVTAGDPDGDSLTYSWNAPNGTVADSGKPDAVWTPATGLAPGEYDIFVTVTDSNGASVSGTVKAIVAGSVRRLIITPSSAVCTLTDTRQFVAKTIDSNSVETVVTPNWGVTGGIGTIGADGLFTPNGVVGNGKIRAEYGGLIVYADLFVYDEVVNPMYGEAAFPLPPELQTASGGSWTYTDTSRFMIGSVRAKVVFFESTGAIDPNIYDWTPAEKTYMLDKIRYGLYWLTTQDPRAHLSFDIDTSPPETFNTSYEPTTHPATDNALFVGEYLASKGYTASTAVERNFQYNDDLRSMNPRTTWAFTIFVTKGTSFTDGYAAYAYLTGPHETLIYRAGSNPIDVFTAHETGHVFGAYDQYTGGPAGGCTNCTQTFGYLNGVNSNCIVCSSAPSLMKYNDWLIDPTAAVQLGWRDSDGDGALDPVDPDNGGSSSMTVVPVTASVAAGTPVNIKATLLNFKGHTISEATVTFTQDAGSASPASVKTYLEGEAQTTLSTVCATHSVVIDTPGLSTPHYSTIYGTCSGAKPKDLHATANCLDINLNWLPGDDPSYDRYTVKRASVSGGPYTQIATGLSAAAYTDPNPGNGSFYYIIIAYKSGNPADQTGPSNEAAAILNCGVVTPPLNLFASISYPDVTLTWTAASPASYDRYTVKRSTVPGGPYTQIATGISSLTYTDPNPGHGIYFYYEVIAYKSGNPADQTGTSNEAFAQIPNLTLPVLTGYSSCPNVELGWSLVLPEVDGYNRFTVKRSAAPGGPYTQAATGLTSLYYTDLNPGDGTWYYIITAYKSSNPADQAPPSNEISVFVNCAATTCPLVTDPGDTLSDDSNLRACIYFANNNPGPDNITFNFSDTITISGMLPDITGDSTSIDADGQNITLSTSTSSRRGIGIKANNCTVKNLTIVNFNYSGNDSSGITIDGGSNNVIQKNKIGSDGTSALPNYEGIIITNGSKNNLIGGDRLAGEGNLISGNRNRGILISGSGTDGNIIKGNNIGTNTTGTAAIKNQYGSVHLEHDAKNTVVGGPAVNDRNIMESVVAQENASGNQIIGNYMGIDVSGYNLLSGGSMSILTSDNLIQGNVISGSPLNGVTLMDTAGCGSICYATNNTVKGNKIGTNAPGTVTIPNTYYGIQLYSSGNIIGGSAPGDGNIIAGNGYSGILMQGANSNIIQGNYIGTNPTGANLINGNHGILITNNSNSNIIGGAGAANTIAFSAAGDGISATNSNINTNYNTFSRNIIYKNAGMGINLAAQINKNIAPPSITSVLQNGINYDIALNIAAAVPSGECSIAKPCKIEIFSVDNPPSVTPDAGGGEAFKFSGDYSATSCGSTFPCNVPFSILIADVHPASTKLTCTITDSDGNTSRFCANFTIPTAVVIPPSSLVASVNCPNVELTWNPASPAVYNRYTVSRSTTSGGPYTQVATGLTTTSYTNANPPVGTFYYIVYAYVSTNPLDRTGNSNEASAIVGCVGGNCPAWKVATTADTGNGSLRQCITEANNAAGVQTITFDNTLIGQIIGINSQLPNFTDNGTTVINTTGGQITIDGNSGTYPCMSIRSANNRIQSLTFLHCGTSPGNYAAIEIRNAAATGNTIAGNYIGTTSTGALGVGNLVGIYINAAANNTIGGTTAADRNIISGNTSGLVIMNAGADNNIVTGNYIGTDPAGIGAIPNTYAVTIGSGAKQNIIGGTNANERNIISGNTTGLAIQISSTGTTSNQVAGNYIGVDITGNTALSNGGGISIGYAANDTTIGPGNIMANGIQAGGFTQIERLTIVGNYIGTDVTGAVNLGNGVEGISFNGRVVSAKIGGSAPGEPNIIAFNGSYGFGISDANSKYNTVSRNRIYGNGGKGIKFFAGNESILPPSITSVTDAGANYSITMNIAAAMPNGCGAANSCRIEIFGVDNPPAVNPDPTGGGEAYQFAQDYTLTTCTAFPCPFTFTIPKATVNAASTKITATITDANGNTSEFAANKDLPIVTNTCPGWKVTSNANSGNGTLRSCINEANAAAGAQTITFQNQMAISLSQNLPVITDSTGGTTINNTTGGEVKVDGNNGVIGCFKITSANNTIRGLTIVNCNNIVIGACGITVSGASASGNTIAGNYMGTNSAGAAGLGNGCAITIQAGANNNTIGGTVAADRNIISGNQYSGIDVVGAGDNNRIIGNYIGTKPNGTTALGNNNYAIQISNDSQRTKVGGAAAGEANLIANTTNPSATDGRGVYITGANTKYNTISHNRIFSNKGLGIDLVGAGANSDIAAPAISSVTDLGGSNYSIAGNVSATAMCPCTVELFRVDDTPASVTPDTSGAGEGFEYISSVNIAAPGAFNFPSVPISSNGTKVTATVTDTNGNTSEFATNFPLQPGPCPGWKVTTNADSGNGSLRLCINEANAAAGAQTITFDSSLIGTTITLASTLPFIVSDPMTITNTTGGEITVSGDGNYGCFVIGSPNNTIHGLTIIKCNYGGLAYGINIDGPGAYGNIITGNYIGTNQSSAPGLGNDMGIVFVGGAHDNIIGGTAAGERNIISGNAEDIVINGHANRIIGNYIGTDVAGAAAIAGGGVTGIHLLASSKNNIIGGSTAAERNVISGHTGTGGTGIDDDGEGGNVIKGNYIGLNAAGTAAIPNEGAGIIIHTVMLETIIGGTTSGDRNVISGNGLGILLGSPTKVLGNYVGTNAAGTAGIGNTTCGIAVGGANNKIGGAASGESNLIAYNGTTSNDAGVLVSGSSSVNNTISHNRIFSDKGLDIKLESGGNNNISAPVITSVTPSGSNYNINGTITCPAYPCSVELFRVDDTPSGVSANPSGSGGGYEYLSSMSIPSGIAFSFTNVPVSSNGTKITATVTDTNGNTSEFALNKNLLSGLTPPSGLTAALSCPDVALSWNNIATATGYILYRSATSGGPYTSLAAPALNPYTDSSTVTVTTYYYVVTAFYGSISNESAYSNEALILNNCITPTIPRPPNPVNSTAIPSGITLNWTAPTQNTDASALTDLSGYKVYRSTTSGGPYTWVKDLSTVAAWTDAAVVPGTNYCYVMTALDSEIPVNESANSMETCSIAAGPKPYTYDFDCGNNIPPHTSAPTPNGELYTPYEVAIDGAGNFYVTNTGNNRIEKYDKDCHFIKKWGSAGNQPGLMTEPRGIMFNPANQLLYVTDKYQRIQTFNTNGDYQFSWASANVVSIGLDAAGNVYAVASGGAGPSNFAAKYSASGTLLGKWDIPAGAAGVAVNAAGEMLVTNSIQKIIERRDSSGNLIGSIGAGSFSSPAGIHISPDGRIFVADKQANYVSVYTADGIFIDKFGGPGNMHEQFRAATDVYVISNTEVLVIDHIQDRVKKFSQK
ncbi:MAG: S8 family serine peptidase [Victivallales bacterium]